MGRLHSYANYSLVKYMERHKVKPDSKSFHLVSDGLAGWPTGAAYPADAARRPSVGLWGRPAGTGPAVKPTWGRVEPWCLMSRWRSAVR